MIKMYRIYAQLNEENEDRKWWYTAQGAWALDNPEAAGFWPTGVMRVIYRGLTEGRPGSEKTLTIQECPQFRKNAGDDQKDFEEGEVDDSVLWEETHP